MTTPHRSIGWQLLGRTERRGAVEIMVKELEKDRSQEQKVTAYVHAKATLDYVYQLKIEANARAEAMVMSSTLLLGALTIAATVLTAKAFDLQIERFLLLAVAIPSAISLLLVFIAHFFVLKVYTPVVVDATSSFEPVHISEIDESALMERALHVDISAATLEILKEARAVSKIHIIRSSLISRSVRFQMIAIIFLAMGILMMGVVIGSKM